MAEIRDFNRNQFLLKGGKNKLKESVAGKEDDRDKKTLDNKLARHRQIKVYAVLAIVIVAAIAAAGGYISWKTKLYISYEVLQQSDWVRAAETKSMNLKGTLFSYSNDGMSCTNTKGKTIWNQTYEMQNPVIRTCGKTVAAGDYNGRKIYISNTQEILGTIETTMPIRDFCVSANGIVAVVLDDSTVTAISLYDTAGTELVGFKTTMSKSGYPIAIDISNDGSLLAVSYLKAENGKIESSIGFYNFASVGQNYTDNLVSGYGYTGAVVPLIHFMANDTVFAVADNRLMFFKGRQKPESISENMISEEIQSVFYDEGHVGLVFYNTSAETTYRIDIYDTNAKMVRSIAFDMEYNDILFSASGIFIYNESECLIYDWDGRTKYEGTFTDKITCFIPGGNISKHTLITEDAIQSIELR